MDFTNPVHPQPVGWRSGADVPARRGRRGGPDHVAFGEMSDGLAGAEEVAA